MEEQISFKDYFVVIPLLGFGENIKVLTTLVTSVQCGSFTLYASSFTHAS